MATEENCQKLVSHMGEMKTSGQGCFCCCGCGKTLNLVEMSWDLIHRIALYGEVMQTVAHACQCASDSSSYTEDKHEKQCVRLNSLRLVSILGGSLKACVPISHRS